MICTPPDIIWVTKWRITVMWWRWEVHTEFCWESEAITLPRYIWQDNVKMNFKERDGRAWTGLVWLRVGTSCRLLWTRYWTFVFHKMRWISWLAEEALASQEGLCYVALLGNTYGHNYCSRVCVNGHWQFLSLYYISDRWVNMEHGWNK